MSTVEFAIVGALFFIVVFAILELGRTLWVWNTLTEATRRGARIAAVCPVNHSAIPRITVFNNATTAGPSPIVAGLSDANVEVRYLDRDGSVIADPVTNFTSIRYVRVRIVNFTQVTVIPFLDDLLAPGFETTLPRESLGVPREGAGPECFGTAV